MKITKTITSLFVLLFLCTSYGLSQNPQLSADMSEIDRIHNMILDSDYHKLKHHFKNGGNVNATDEVGNSPLHFAAKIGDQRIVRLLLKKGADINKANITGTTSLMIASKYNNSTTVKLLLEKGADPTLKNKTGLTALNFADMYKHDDVSFLLTSN